LHLSFEIKIFVTDRRKRGVTIEFIFWTEPKSTCCTYETPAKWTPGVMCWYPAMGQTFPGTRGSGEKSDHWTVNFAIRLAKLIKTTCCLVFCEVDEKTESGRQIRRQRGGRQIRRQKGRRQIRRQRGGRQIKRQ
jgi:hypothetical protein